MDIIDIMLARAMTPQGQTETYVSIANAAAAKAEKAKSDAEEAIATVESAAEDITAAQEAAADLLASAQEALETAQEAQINTLDIEDVDEEIKKMKVTRSQVTTNASEYYENLHVTYPDGTGYVLPGTVMLQKKTGTSEVAGMTQKAITDALNLKADISALALKADISTLAEKADKSYVDAQIAAIPTSGGSGGGQINMGVDDAGHLVIIDENGNLVASLATDEAIIEALLRAGTYTAKDAVGLDIDYANRAFTRTQEAINKTMGNDFNSYPMYGGRTRCNVTDNGVITAFYGNDNYTEDGSNGQVMVYQPKFYYKRIIRSSDELTKGKVVRHEALIISATAQPGFKLAPVFKGDLDYVLLPAFDAGLLDNKLTSIAGVLPVTNLTIAQAESYANARGDGWHIMNMEAESTNQMLEIVEFGHMNGQNAIESGITYAPDVNGKCYFITGSTSSLGNATGHADSTQISVNGNISTMNDAGKRAISYRGMENPWGNLWSMIGGINIIGNGASNGGVPYICTDFNYTPGIAGSNYVDIGFNLPQTYGWVNAMGYGNSDYDWVYLPIECSASANSLLPVGDGLWTVPSLNNAMIIAAGGSFGFKEECGPFYYAADRTATTCSRDNYGAKLLFIPTKNEAYTANIAKWNTYMGA